MRITDPPTDAADRPTTTDAAVATVLDAYSPKRDSFDFPLPPPPPLPPPAADDLAHYISSDDEVMQPDLEELADSAAILHSHVLANPYSVPLPASTDLAEHHISPIIRDSSSESDLSDPGGATGMAAAPASAPEHMFILSDSDSDVMAPDRSGLAEAAAILALQARANPFSVPIAAQPVGPDPYCTASVQDDAPEQEFYTKMSYPPQDFSFLPIPSESDSSSSDDDDDEVAEPVALATLEELPEPEPFTFVNPVARDRSPDPTRRDT